MAKEIINEFSGLLGLINFMVLLERALEIVRVEGTVPEYAAKNFSTRKRNHKIYEKQTKTGPVKVTIKL